MSLRPLLVDANNHIVRCIMASALGDLQAGGIWTGGVFGALRSLKSMMDMPELKPSGVIACFDGGVPAHRLTLIPEFKAERKAKREMLDDADKEAAMVQLDMCWEVFEALGVTCLKYKDREADDALAALTRIFVSHGVTPVVASGDGDMLQCVKMGAEVWNLREKQWYDADNFASKVGLIPECFLLYKTLVGDPSDGIDGARGFGDKKTLDLIRDVAQDIDTSSNGGYSLCDDDPERQLEVVVDFLQRKEKRNKAEDRLIEDYPRLNKEMRGIDLSNSWGPLTKLEARIKVLPKPPDRMAYLRFCKRLNLNSLIGDHASMMRTFDASHAGYAALVDSISVPA